MEEVARMREALGQETTEANPRECAEPSAQRTQFASEVGEPGGMVVHEPRHQRVHLQPRGVTAQRRSCDLARSSAERESVKREQKRRKERARREKEQSPTSSLLLIRKKETMGLNRFE